MRVMGSRQSDLTPVRGRGLRAKQERGTKIYKKNASPPMGTRSSHRGDRRHRSFWKTREQDGKTDA